MAVASALPHDEAVKLPVMPPLSPMLAKATTMEKVAELLKRGDVRVDPKCQYYLAHARRPPPPASPQRRLETPDVVGCELRGHIFSDAKFDRGRVHDLIRVDGNGEIRCYSPRRKT